MTGFDPKNCQNSNLKITICTLSAAGCRTKLWKTTWKVFNSTGKTGIAAGLLNIFHMVFNLWKNQGCSTECIACLCGKLCELEKQRQTSCRAAKHFCKKECGAGGYGGRKNSAAGRIKNGIWLAKAGRLCYTLRWSSLERKQRGAPQGGQPCFR